MVKKSKEANSPKKSKARDDGDEGPSPSSKADDGKDGGATGRPTGGGSIGQRTSQIKNKQQRSELYHKLKHQKEVRRLLVRGAANAQEVPCGGCCMCTGPYLVL